MLTRHHLRPYLVHRQTQTTGKLRPFLHHVHRDHPVGQVDNGEVAGTVPADLPDTGREHDVFGPLHQAGGHDALARKLGGQLPVGGPDHGPLNDRLVQRPAVAGQPDQPTGQHRHLHPPRGQIGVEQHPTGSGGHGPGSGHPPPPRCLPLPVPIQLQPRLRVIPGRRSLPQLPVPRLRGCPPDDPTRQPRRALRRIPGDPAEVDRGANRVNPGVVSGHRQHTPHRGTGLVRAGQPRRQDRHPAGLVRQVEQAGQRIRRIHRPPSNHRLRRHRLRVIAAGPDQPIGSRGPILPTLVQVNNARQRRVNIVRP
jgi:hypothetical protein